MKPPNRLDHASRSGADLAPFIPGYKLHQCQDGGSYVMGKLSQSPRCSVAGHELPQRRN